MRSVITIEETNFYKIFFDKKSKMYFFDNYITGTCHGFDTLTGAKESAYYAELRNTKN